MGEPSVSAATGLRVVAEPVPRAVVFAAWWNAWEAGDSPADDLIDALSPFGSHTLQHPDDDAEPLLVGLAKLRAQAGSGRATAVLPVPGDAAGLPGPPDVNQLAVQAGQAVLAPGIALVPAYSDGQTTWVVLPADADRIVNPPVRPEEAATAVREALHESTAALAALDLGGNREAVADALRELSAQLRKLRLPPSLPGTHAHTAHSAARVLGIVTIAYSEDSSTLSGAAREERSRVLSNLARTARHCLAAACSAR